MKFRIYRRFALTAVGFFLLLAFPASAERADTFMVTLVTKTPAHPFYDMGYSLGFAVDGVEGKTLVLERGKTYRFQFEEEPFDDYNPTIYTIPIGGSNGAFERNINYSNINSWFEVTPDEQHPDTVYYACPRQPYMGGMILIVDSITSTVVDNERRGGVGLLAGSLVSPNPFSSETAIEFSLSSPSRVRVEIVDALGRSIWQRDAGVRETGEQRVRIDGQEFSPGVYYYRIEAFSGERKDILSGQLQVLQ